MTLTIMGSAAAKPNTGVNLWDISSFLIELTHWFNRHVDELWHKSLVFLLNRDTKFRLLSHGLQANMS